MSKNSLSLVASPPESLLPATDKAIEIAISERYQPERDLATLSLFDPNFPQQEEFIRDTYRRKALWCTRRAAKSYTAGMYLCEVANKFHGVNCLYLSLTKDSAMGIIWKDILQVIDSKHELGMHFRESKRDVESRTGSMVYISGADADADEMQKLLGRKYKLIIIDEAQAFSIDMRALIYGILGPTLIDQGGTICIMGTSGNLVQGLFYDVSNGKEPGWKLFSWTAFDNPYVAKQWQEELDEIDKTRPLFKRTALYRQWYLNEWVIDEDAKVYKFSPSLNRASALPPGITDWRYVLGLDLAHSPDSTAFVVGAYHGSSKVLYLVYAHKKTKMDLTDVANFVRTLDERYHFDVRVVDGANKQAVAELNNRHSLGLIPAPDKTQKADFIKIMNDDFIQGQIKLLPDTECLYNPRASAVGVKGAKDGGEELGEYQKLIWVLDANQKVIEPRKESPNIHNDAADGALYLWRYCYQYLFVSQEEYPDRSRQSIWEPAHIKKLEEQVRKEQNPDEMALDWNAEWDEDWKAQSGE